MNKYHWLTGKYSVLQIGFWMDYLIVTSFAALFLTGRGASSVQVGTLTALASMAAMFLQPIAGSLADKAGKISIRTVMSSLMIMAIIAILALIFLPHALLPTFVFFFVALSMTTTISPILIGLQMQYANSGHVINYGIARALGSLGYAVNASLCGSLADRFGAEVVLPVYLVIMGIMLVVTVFLMPNPEPADLGDDKEAEKPVSMFEFIRKYKQYDLMILGVMFSFFLQFIMSTYMIYVVRSFGGNEAEMGSVLSLVAMSEIPAVIFGVPIMNKIGTERMLRIFPVAGLIKYILLFFFVKDMTGFTMVHLLHMLYSGIYQVPIVYFTNKIVGRRDVVKAQALMGVACTGVLGMTANFLGGFLFQVLSVKTILGIGIITGSIGLVLVFMATSKRLFPDKNV